MSEEIAIEQVVARAMIQARVSGPQAQLDFQIFAEEAVNHLKCLSSYAEQEKIIDLVDGRGPLPCGFFKFLFMRTYDENGDCCCGDAIYTDTIFRRCCNAPIYPYYRDCYTLFKIINGQVHMHMPTDVTRLHFTYLGLPKNDQNLTIIHARYERAIWNYIMWMYSMQPGSNIPKDDKAVYFQTWKAQKEMLGGEDIKNQWDLTKWWIGEVYLNKVEITPKL